MITLSREEVEALRRALDAYLPELAFELARIELVRDRHELAATERVLAALRQRLTVDEEPRTTP